MTNQISLDGARISVGEPTMLSDGPEGTAERCASFIDATPAHRMLRLRIEPESEVIDSIRRAAAQAGIANGALAPVIGAVDSAEVTVMVADDPRADERRACDEPCELHGSGEIVDGEVHLHCCLGLPRGGVLSGHLVRASVRTWFVDVYITPVTV